MKAGVLALQGAFREHREVLDALGVDAVEVRTPEQLGGLDALFLPGGESTTITKLLDTSGLRRADPDGARATGSPVFGTCAGLIVLARRPSRSARRAPRRRCSGCSAARCCATATARQLDSFEAPLRIDGIEGTFPGVFIRAPLIESVRADVEVLADARRAPGARPPGPGVGRDVPSGAVRRSAIARTIPPGGGRVSGHSKWHSIKHAKGAADAARGKVFARLARQIEVAARQGGGDIEGNPTLRTMVQKARDASMPKDNIERAIKRGIGELDGVTYEQVQLRGLRAERRRGLRRDAHRQPQPHRLRGEERRSPATAARWPSPAR